MGTPAAADKTKAGLSCVSMLAKQIGGKLFQGIQALGKFDFGLVFTISIPV